MTARLRPFKPVPYGRFTLVAPLAVGGMGEIYLARASFPGGLEKLCVIKKILPHLAEDPEFSARFRDEARTLLQLQHGSIAQVFETGFEGSDFFIALEFVDGKDLRKVMQRALEANVRLPVELSLYLVSRILEALAYAHRRRDERGTELGLVHRDVSPQNVLLSYEGEVKVIDFGLAKSQLSRPHTRPSVVLGKFYYMAPEQARAGKLDRRVDLYALGIILWELLAGKNPFEDTPPYEILERVGNPRIPPIASVVPGLPSPLPAMLDRALEPDPQLRFQSAEEMRARLSEVLFALRPDAGPDLLSSWLRQQFTAEYEAERRLIAQVTGARLPLEVLAPPAAEPEATRAQADTEGDDDTERFDRKRPRPQHVEETQRFDPDEDQATPGPQTPWFREPASRPDLLRAEPEEAIPPGPTDLPWSPPAPPPVPLDRETTQPRVAQPTRRPTSRRPAGRRLVVTAGAAAALALLVLLLVSPRAAPDRVVTKVTPSASQESTPAPAPEPAPPPAPPSSDPVDAAPIPQPEPAVARPRHAAMAPKPEGTPAPRAESDRRSKLEHRREAIDRLYQEMVAHVGEQKVGAIVIDQKRALDSSFDRLIGSPDRYDELDSRLSELERNLRERRSDLR